jgi:hypothetical protein
MRSEDVTKGINPIACEWASDEDWRNYVDELTRYGSAVCVNGEDGLTRHCPRPEWMPAPTENET